MSFSSPLIHKSHLISSSPANLKITTTASLSPPGSLITLLSGQNHKLLGCRPPIAASGSSALKSGEMGALSPSQSDSPPNLDICLLYPDTAPLEIWKPQVNTWMRRHHFSQAKDISKAASPTPIYNSLDNHWSILHEKSCQQSYIQKLEHDSESALNYYNNSLSSNSLKSLKRRFSSSNGIPGSTFSSECPNKIVSSFSALNQNYVTKKNKSCVDQDTLSQYSSNIDYDDDALFFENNEDQTRPRSFNKPKRRRTNSITVGNFVAMTPRSKPSVVSPSNPSFYRKNGPGSNATGIQQHNVNDPGFDNDGDNTKTLLPSPSLIQNDVKHYSNRPNTHQPQQIVLQPPSPPSSPNSKKSANNGEDVNNNDYKNASSINNASNRLSPTTTLTTANSKKPATTTCSTNTTTTHTFHAKRRCISCGSDQSPCWRPSWSVAEGQLCNSCGLRYKKTNARCLNKSCGRVPAKGEWITIKNNAIQGADGNMLYQCFYCGGEIEVKKV